MANSSYEIPLFPLKTVLFPQVPLELKIFEPRYNDMIAQCLRNDSPFGVVLIYQGEETDMQSEVFSMGTTARISAWHDRSDGLLGITALGEQRFEIINTRQQKDGLVIAEVQNVAEDAINEVPEQYHYMPELLRHITHKHEPKIDIADEFYLVLYQLIHLLPIDNTLKQRLLEVPNCMDRAVILHAELIRIGIIQYVDPKH